MSAVEIDHDWLTLGHELADAAQSAERLAASLNRRAKRAYWKAGIRDGEEDSPKVDRILWNDRDANDIDEIVLHDVMVHVEQMHDRCWWIGIYRDAEHRWAGNFSCDSRGQMTFSEQENDLEWDRDDSHEEKP